MPQPANVINVNALLAQVNASNDQAEIGLLRDKVNVGYMEKEHKERSLVNATRSLSQLRANGVTFTPAEKAALEAAIWATAELDPII